MSAEFEERSQRLVVARAVGALRLWDLPSPFALADEASVGASDEGDAEFGEAGGAEEARGGDAGEEAGPEEAIIAAAGEMPSYASLMEEARAQPPNAPSAVSASECPLGSV